MIVLSNIKNNPVLFFDGSYDITSICKYLNEDLFNKDFSDFENKADFNYWLYAPKAVGIGKNTIGIYSYINDKLQNIFYLYISNAKVIQK